LVGSQDDIGAAEATARNLASSPLRAEPAADHSPAAQPATEQPAMLQNKSRDDLYQALNDPQSLSSLSPLPSLIADIEGAMSGKLTPERVAEVYSAVHARESVEQLARIYLESPSVVTEVDIRPLKLTDGFPAQPERFGIPFSSLRSVVFTADDSHLVCATERGLLGFLNLSLYSLD